MITWEIILFLAAAIHGLILSIVFILGGQSQQKRFLGLYLMAFSGVILYYINYWTKVFHLPLFLTWLGAICSWLMPFLFYFFINPKAKLSQIKYHLIVPFLFTCYFIGIRLIEVSPELYPYFGHLIMFSNIALFLFYGVLIIINYESKKINVVFLIPYGSFILGLLAYKISTMTGLYTLRMDYIICGGFVILTYGITYFSEFSFLKEKVRPKYATSSLTKEDGDHLVAKINEVLNESKYYRDPDFNLSSFADKLGVPKYRISQALNAFSEKSFSELVNEFRVEEAKEKLQLEACNHLKLEAIGEEVGFKNKVSFYSNFKKFVGKSPGEFREMKLQQGIDPQ